MTGLLCSRMQGGYKIRASGEASSAAGRQAWGPAGRQASIILTLEVASRLHPQKPRRS